MICSTNVDIPGFNSVVFSSRMVQDRIIEVDLIAVWGYRCERGEECSGDSRHEYQCDVRCRSLRRWEHVDSKANCSDMPSRGDLEFVESELHATFYHTILDEYAWSRPAYQWFY